MQEMSLESLHWESPWSSLDHHVTHNFIILLQGHQSRWVKRIFMWGSGVLLLHFASICHNYIMCWNSAGWPVYRLLTNVRLSGVQGNQSYPINVSKVNRIGLGFVKPGLSAWDCKKTQHLNWKNIVTRELECSTRNTTCPGWYNTTCPGLLYENMG